VARLEPFCAYGVSHNGDAGMDCLFPPAVRHHGREIASSWLTRSAPVNAPPGSTAESRRRPPVPL